MPRSLTLRLTLLFAIASGMVLALFGYVLYTAVRAHFLHEDVIELKGKVELVRNLAGQVRAADDIDRLRERLRDALIGHSNLALAIATPDGVAVLTWPDQPSMPSAENRRVLEQGVVDGFPVALVAVGDREFRTTAFDLATSDPVHPRLRAELALGIEHHRMFMARLAGIVLLSLLAGTLAAVLLGWLAVRVGIQPLRSFSSLASRISADRLDDRIAVAGLPPELTELGRSFNAMLNRLGESFRRLHDFSSDLAHELRTPIGALMTQAQVALSRARSAEEYRETIYAAMEEYERLARMTTDMLFLAKTDAGLLLPEAARVDIRAETMALLEFYDALAESRQLRFQVTGDGVVRGDRDMLRRALSNVLSNAIRHAIAASKVDVVIRVVDSVVEIGIANLGVPIPAAHLPRLFDRFYMVDPARNRLGDRAGLGLAITKAIVVAHGGSIDVMSDTNGTRFVLSLPAADVAA
ncbi:MAG: heavy metal sensor histidine kinase [Casimicrobiaceae bacterium]